MRPLRELQPAWRREEPRHVCPSGNVSQRLGCRAAGVERIFTDTAGGASTDRPQLAACLDYLRAGDTLVVWRLDRLGRSLRHFVEVVDQLQASGKQLRSIADGIDTSTPGGTLTFSHLRRAGGVRARADPERTRAGLAAARRRGTELGRRRVVTPTKLRAAQALKAEGLTVRQVADEIGVSKTALYEALRASRAAQT